MAALAALRGERIESAQDALERTLEHERRFWRSRIKDLRLDGARSSSLEEAVEPAVAALTLVQGVADEGRARDLLQHTRNPPGLPTDLFESLLGLLKTLYGGTESLRFLEPLQPDSLGEQLVAERLRRDSGWLSKVIVEASLEERMGVLVVLFRLAQRRPEAHRWLEGALRNHLEDLAEAAVLVTIATGDLMGKTLAEILRTHPSKDVAKLIMDLCNREEFQASIQLSEVALIATQNILDSIRATGDTSEQGQNERARVLNDLGERLSALGRLEEALQATQEAVGIFRQLAEERPDAFLPYLAMSLHNLSIKLSKLGRREEALWAAQQGVEIRRQLAERSPDALLPALATSLNSLGLRLSDFGRWEEALQATQEAATFYRVLAGQKPDAFLSAFSMSLHNLGKICSALGRREEALQATQGAVEIRRQLADQRPDVFLPDLAASLSNLGCILSDLGRREEALQATQEAVGIFRQLAGKRPATFLPDLASSLNNLSRDLGGLGRNEEALPVTEEAIRTLAPFFVRYPDGFFSLMLVIVRTYLDLMGEFGREPDKQLLSPIMALLSERFAPPDSTSSG